MPNPFQAALHGLLLAALSLAALFTAPAHADEPPAKIALSGTATQPQISIVPEIVKFGYLAVGYTNSQTVTIKNPGTANLEITKFVGPGAGFSISGVSLPISVAPQKSATFTLKFHPTSLVNYASSLVLYSNAPNSPTPIFMSGTGTASINKLSASETSLNFGTRLLETTNAQNVTLTNAGSTNVTLSRISVNSSSFSITAPALPVTLLPGHSINFSVSFKPAITGSINGTASVVSTASDSPLAISLSGTGTKTLHSVALRWTASRSAVVGYFIYSAMHASGPYTRLNSSPVPNTSYTDAAVESGLTYYYVVTAVDLAGVESSHSNGVTAIVP